MMPTNVAARMTLAADPTALQGAVAAGILGAGPVVLGTSEECALLLEDASRRAAAGARAAAVVARPRSNDAGVRRARSRASATRCIVPSTRGRSGSSSSPTSAASAASTSQLARLLRDAVAEEWGKPLPMNVSLPIAAVMLDLGYSVGDRQGRPDPRADGGPARTPRRGAGEPARVPLAGKAEEAIAYEAPPAE